MRSKNAPTVNHHAKTFTVIVKEKPGGVYVACLGDEPTSDKKSVPRNWGLKSFWGERGWADVRDKKDLWKNVLDAFKNDNRYEKERNYTVNFQHFILDQRCKQLGLNREAEEARRRSFDADWIEWANANGYSPPAQQETNYSATDLAERDDIVFKQISIPDDKTEFILPSIPDADSFINRLRSIIDQPERNMEDAVKELLVRLGHAPNRIVFQRGRVDLILEDNSGKPAFVFEVKRSIASESERAKARRQAVDYSYQTGARFIVITDADRYEIYDRHRGLDFDSMHCGRFQLTQFKTSDEAVLDLLRLPAE